MRELQMANVRSGIDDVFADVVVLAEECRFSDCRHETEPGCAVLAATESGVLDADRLKRWRKLAAEEAHNSGSLTERRANNRAFGKMVKAVIREKRQREGGERSR